MNSCNFECLKGYYRLDETCMPCNDYCNVGEFRSGCGGASSGECLACTNGPVNSMYLSPGDPCDSNTCSWGCNKGICDLILIDFLLKRWCTRLQSSLYISVDFALTIAEPGFYRHENDCWRCNTSLCSVGEYREVCPAGSSVDGNCKSCSKVTQP